MAERHIQKKPFNQSPPPKAPAPLPIDRLPRRGAAACRRGRPVAGDRSHRLRERGGPAPACLRNYAEPSATTSEICTELARERAVLAPYHADVSRWFWIFKRGAETRCRARPTANTAISGIRVTPMPTLTICTRSTASCHPGNSAAARMALQNAAPDRETCPSPAAAAASC